MPDVFISYSHKDNEFPKIEGRGWIEHFYDALKAAVTRARGRETDIALDREGMITGSSILTPTIKETLEKTRALVIIVSPSYVTSKWCEDELQFFREAAGPGGLRIGTRTRVLKVNKLPVSGASFLGRIPELEDSTGYDFFQTQAGKPFELEPPHGAVEGKEFFRTLNALAYDLKDLLDGPAVDPSGTTIYLAETTSDVKDLREKVRMELLQFGHAVIPSREIAPGPTYAMDVRTQLGSAQLSVHIIGSDYGIIPELATRSLNEIQFELAGEEASQRPEFLRLAFLAGAARASDPKQTAFIEKLRDDAFEGSLENFKTMIKDAVSRSSEIARAQKMKGDAQPRGDIKHVYVIFDAPDRDAAKPVSDWLHKQGFEILRPILRGTASEIRKMHNQHLSESDGVLIYQGNTTEFWLQTKLSDLRKVFRKRERLARGVLLADPDEDYKREFRSHEIRVLPGFGNFSPTLLSEFIEDLGRKGPP